MNPEDRPPQVVGMGIANECAKAERPRDSSYIDHNPANMVVLSPKLEQAVRRVGGCQTEEVLALVRQIMYEVISRSKY
jgi:hypothetical protein